MGSSGGGSPSNTTQTTVTELPKEVAPYIGPSMEESERLSRTPFSEYSGERISPLTPSHGAGLIWWLDVRCTVIQQWRQADAR